MTRTVLVLLLLCALVSENPRAVSGHGRGRGSRHSDVKDRPLTLTECGSFRKQLKALEAQGPLGWIRSGVAAKPGYSRRKNVCWSRAEWYCFAGVNLRAKPSMGLLRMLVEYRRRWKACNKLESKEDIRRTLRSGKPTKCKYMLWSPTKDGLGNQMLSVVAAFVYSLLTSRILLIEPSASISSLFCSPFRKTPSWQFRHEEEFGGELFWTHDSEGSNYSYRVNRPFNLDAPTPNVVTFYVHLWSDQQPFFCPKFHEWASHASALVCSSNMFWVPALYYIPKFREQLKDLFPSRRVFSTLAPLIFHPNNRIWEKVTRFLGLHKGEDAAEPTLRIGLQFRKKFGVRMNQALEGSSSCFEALLAAFNRNLRGNPEANGKESRNITVFLASLDKKFREGLGALMKDHGLQGSTVTLTKDTAQKSDDVHHNELAIADMYSLALVSDVLLLTPRSTFGYTVAGLSPAEPYLLPSCQRAMSEPCFLLPPNRVACDNTSSWLDWLRDREALFRIDGGSIVGLRPHILRSCPDAEWVHANHERQRSTGVVAIPDDVHL